MFPVPGYKITTPYGKRGKYWSCNRVNGLGIHTGVDVAAPKGKKVVLGIVTSKAGTLESKDELKRRIDEAAKYIPLDSLCLSPQCGFASTHHGNKLTVDEQWRKLERIVEVAQEVWGGN